jgi:ankyrin repeat protein
MRRINPEFSFSLADVHFTDVEAPRFKATLKAVTPQGGQTASIDTDLAEAIAKGDVEAVRERLASLPEGAINGTDAEGRTALHLALGAENKQEIVRLLVENGRIDVASLDGDGKSALSLALEGRAAAKDPALIPISDYLLGRMNSELGKAVEDRDHDRARALVEAGAPATGEYRGGVTYLSRAAAHGDLETVKLLLEAIPEDRRSEIINKVDQYNGNTAMHAAALGSPEVYALLAEAGGRIDTKNVDGKTPEDLKGSLEKRGDHEYVGSTYGALRWDELMPGTGTWEPAPPAPSDYEFGGGYAIRPFQDEEHEAYGIQRELSERLGYPVMLSWQVLNAGTANERLVAQIGNIALDGGQNRTLREQVNNIMGQLRSLREGSRSYTGRFTLNRIFGSGEVVVWAHDPTWNTADRTASGQIRIRTTGLGGIDATTAGETWGSPEQSPAHVVAMEQLIFAANMIEGHDTGEPIRSNGIDVPRLAALSIGLGEYAGQQGTLNAYRAEWNLDRRTFFDDAAELDDAGDWGEHTLEESVVSEATHLLNQAGIEGRAFWHHYPGEDGEADTVALQFGNIRIFGNFPDLETSIEEQMQYIDGVIEDFGLMLGWEHGTTIFTTMQNAEEAIYIERSEAEGWAEDNEQLFDEEQNAYVIRLTGVDFNLDELGDYTFHSDATLVHESLHVYNELMGLTDNRPYDIERLRHQGLTREEARTDGHGEYANLLLTQRAYEAYRGYEQRPAYATLDELDENGNWGGISATNPHDWNSQYEEIRRYEAEQGDHRWERRSSEESGYEVIETDREYEELMSGEAGVVTRFSYDHEFKDIIRFHQEKDGKIINQGVIDKEATPEIAGRAMYERDFMDAVREGKVDFRALLMLRFKTGTGRPEWSPALDRVVDDWLKTAPLSADEETRMADEIAAGTGAWSRQELRAVLDSGVLDNRGDLKAAVTEELEPEDEVVNQPILNDKDYERVLNALVETIRAGTNIDDRQTLAMTGSLAEQYKQLLEYKRRHPTPGFVNEDDLDAAQILNQQVLDDFLPRLRNFKKEADVFEGYLGHQGGHAVLLALAEEVAGAEPVAYDGDVTRFFQESVMKGDVAAVAKLIRDNPDDFDINAKMPIAPGMNALEVLVAQGWNARDTLHMARVLLEGGIDVAHIDNEGMSAYQRALSISKDDRAKGDYKGLAALIRARMNDELGEAIAAGDDDAVARLVKAGADPNAPLLEAVYARDIEMVEMILDNMPEGADINALDGYGRTALHQAVVETYATAHLDSNTDLITLLIEKGGADITTKDRTGRTAYELIAPYGQGERVTQSTKDEIALLRDKATEKLREAIANNADEATIEALIKAGAVRD